MYNGILNTLHAVPNILCYRQRPAFSSSKYIFTRRDRKENVNMTKKIAGINLTNCFFGATLFGREKKILILCCVVCF